MVAVKNTKMLISMPQTLADDVSEFAKELKQNKSALVSQALEFYLDHLDLQIAKKEVLKKMKQSLWMKWENYHVNKYSLDFDKKASKDILSLDRSTRDFILDELEIFINNYDESYEKELMKLTKIKALKGEYKGLYRLRLRTYRVIYEKQNDRLVILVLRVSHRKDVYR